MKLQTELNIPQENNPIDYTATVLLLGSCFTENIGAKLEYFKFQNTINPFGILFHPLAIEKVIKRAVTNNHYTDNDVFFHNEKWQSFEAHSQLSHTSKEGLIEQLNKSIIQLKQAIETATHVICTYGTSWVYRNIAINEIVANCHKMPQKQFTKELLEPDTISEVLSGIATVIASVNPKAVLIHTVSPVRHIKDGIIENNVSKAHLLTAIHNFKKQRSSISNLHSFYFPSYEIMMDELRDYRFYAQDLIHPNETAIEIIWEKFNNAWIASETLGLQKKIDTIQKGLQHRPFNENSDAHLKFKEKLQHKISEVEKQLPEITFKNN